MDAPFYVLILQKHIPEISKMMGSQWRLQQDNDTKHANSLAKGFLEKNVSQVIDWPANNPDVNPIKIYGVSLNEIGKENATKFGRFGKNDGGGMK